MLELILLKRDELLQETGCSRRLATRIGALLGKKVAITATVFEETCLGSALEKLILKRDLLQTDDMSECIAELIKKDEFAELREDFPLTVTEQEEWTVIAAEEELLADSSWGESKEVAKINMHSGTTASDSASSAFSEQETNRLRVMIFAGATSQEKVAALRQFAFTDDQAQKVSVFMQACADEDCALRAASAQGLRAMGADSSLCDNLRLLAEGTDDEKSTAAQRLRDVTDDASMLNLNALSMGIVGSMRDASTPTQVMIELFTSLEKLAPRLGAERLCNEDIFRTVLERGLSVGVSCAHGFFSSTEKLMPGWSASALMLEASKTGSHEYRGLIIEILTGLDLNDDISGQLAEIACDTLLELSPDTQTSRTITSFVISSGNALLLCERIVNADIAHQRFLIRTFDNLLTGDYSEELGIEIAESCLKLLYRSPLQVRSDILDTKVCSRSNLPEELRQRICCALIKDMHFYNHWPLAETMQQSLVRLGAPAMQILLRSLAEHSDGNDAQLLATAIGLIGQKMSEEPSQLAVAEDALRELQKLSFNAKKCRGEVFMAMGRICASPNVSKDISSLILRTLLNRLQGSAEDAPTIEGLGFACCGQAGDEANIRTVSGIALKHLGDAQPAPTLTIEKKQGEDLFCMGEEVDIYAHLLPACIAALRQICLSESTAQTIKDELIGNLLELWQQAISFHVVWSPANIALLTTAIGDIGASDISIEQRTRICHTLSGRAKDIPVLEALAGILSKPASSAELDRLAGAILLRLLATIEATEDLSSDDQETYLRVLGKIVGRGKLEIRGGGEDRLIERVIDAIASGLREGVSKCLQTLSNLSKCENLDQKHIQRINEELKDYTSIKVRN